MKIRRVLPTDHTAISVLLVSAFGQSNEANLVQSLRDTEEIAVELVAESPEGLVGHVCLSRLLAPEGWLAVAPVSVRPEDQGRGVGGELVRYGLDAARQAGYAAVVVVGEPKYYHRFGFIFEGAEKKITSPYPPQYTGLYPIDPSTVRARVALAYPKAFETA